MLAVWAAGGASGNGCGSGVHTCPDVHTDRGVLRVPSKTAYGRGAWGSSMGQSALTPRRCCAVSPSPLPAGAICGDNEEDEDQQKGAAAACVRSDC